MTSSPTLTPPVGRAAARPRPDARHFIGGSFVEGGPSFLDVHRPADGGILSRVPLGGTALVAEAVTAARAARRDGRRPRSRSGSRCSTATRRCWSEHLDELGALITRGARQDPERGRGGDPQGGRADRVRLLAAADRGGRSAGGEPGRRVPAGAGAARAWWPRSIRSTSPDGAALDHPQRHRAGQHLHHEAVGAGAAERADGSPSCCRRPGFPTGCSTWCTGAGRPRRRSAIIPASRPSPSSARPRWRRRSTAGARGTSSGCWPWAAPRTISS